MQFQLGVGFTPAWTLDPRSWVWDTGSLGFRSLPGRLFIIRTPAMSPTYWFIPPSPSGVRRRPMPSMCVCVLTSCPRYMCYALCFFTSVCLPVGFSAPHTLWLCIPAFAFTRHSLFLSSQGVSSLGTHARIISRERQSVLLSNSF